MTGDKLTETAMFFDGSRLTMARHVAGLRKNHLAQLVKRSEPAVAAWESGANRPTAGSLKRIAAALDVDPGFFAMRPDNVAEHSTTPHFRSIRSTTIVQRDQATAYGHLALDTAVTIGRRVELPPVTLPIFPVNIDDDETSPERAAQTLRKQWGLGDNPVRNLIKLAENHGVFVVWGIPQTAPIGSYSFTNPKLRPVIVLNPNQTDYYKQRYETAYELGHLVMNTHTQPGGRPTESLAERFAAELLTPASALFNDLPDAMNSKSWRTLAKLKEQWGVSLEALLRRAHALQRLPYRTYTNALYTTMTTRGWRRKEPGLITVTEQPSLLPRAVNLLEQQGATRDDIAEQCRTPARFFDAVTSHTPREMP